MKSKCDGVAMEDQMNMFGDQRQHDGIFYNTTNLEGKDLRKAKERVQTQGDIILDIFKKYGRLSPSTVQNVAKDMSYLWPITSVRRAITVLTDQKLLTKTSCKIEGNYGALEHIWEVVK
jgi:hypothetical protein